MFRSLSWRLCAAGAGTSAGAAAAAAVGSSSGGGGAPEQPLIPAAGDMTPRQIVQVLDLHVVGQAAAKRAMAVAMRNRWRRRALQDDGLRQDITPKNILMIGPTGVGKTELARRIAKLTDAPFIKVEATKYTEVGFKGKDVDSIIEELYTNAKMRARKKLERERDAEASEIAHDSVFAAFMRNRATNEWKATSATTTSEKAATTTSPSAADDGASTTTTPEPKKPLTAASITTIAEYRELFNAGQLNDITIPITVTVTQPKKPQSPQPEGGGGAGSILFGLFGGGGDQQPVKQKQHLVKSIPEAFELLKTEAFDKLINDAQVSATAKSLAESDGIVFIDEIDKVVSPIGAAGSDSNDIGVQQDLLPIIEGSTVTMKDGTPIDTAGILFICCGAFHSVKPSEMIAELQGRLPVRVELSSMSQSELRRVLTEPRFNLLSQTKALLKTEQINVQFADSGIDAIAEVAAAVNRQAQNTGARRLSTIVERVMDDVSFDIEQYRGKEVVIDAAWVKKATGSIVANVDLSRYLL